MSLTRTTHMHTASGLCRTARSDAAPRWSSWSPPSSHVAAPALAWVTQHLVSPGAGTPWFFTLWGSTLVALVVATAAAAVAAVALVRDHALLLLAPVAFAVIGVAALITTNGVLS